MQDEDWWFSLINIGLYYRVKRGYEREFEKIFAQALDVLKVQDFGFLGGKLYKEVGDMGEYLLYTEWRDMESFRKFMGSKEYAKIVELGKAILDGQPRHRIFME